MMRFDGAGPWSRLEGRGAIDVAGARYGNINFGDLAAGLVLNARELFVNLAAGAIGVTAQARINRDDRQAVVDLQAVDVEVERLLQDAGLPSALAARLSLIAHGEGRLDDWRGAIADVTLSSLAARFGELPIDLTAPARLAYGDGVVDVRALEATIGGLRLAASGRLPAFGPAPAAPSDDAIQAVIVGDVAAALDAVRGAGPATLPIFPQRVASR